MLWAASLLVRGAEAVWRFLRRRRTPVSGDPAEELRRKLAESRGREDEPEPVEQEPASRSAEEASEPELPSVAGEESNAAADELESLRRSVHTRARVLTEEMRGANDDS
jgi:hypothetical protein